MLKKAHDLNLIEEVRIGKAKVSLKHLQFADDILLFVPKNTLCIINYFRILDIFALMSGLAINYNKSAFICWKSDDFTWVNEIANGVGCIHARPPFTYLGFPLGSNFSNFDAWKPVIRKIENRLASWKVRLLSKAGRLTLIKSVLNSLPVYFMSLFKMPKTVAAKIVKLQRRFFWGGPSGESTSCHPVKWSDIELPKEMEGLGVGNILHKNLILLFKWWWRFSESDSSLWKRIIKSFHDINGDNASMDNFRKVRTGTWSCLMGNDSDTVKVRAIIEEGMRLRVGENSSIRFWHDRWCESGVLKCIFPRLFAISIQKYSKISQMGEWNGNSWVWSLQWRRLLFDWEIEDMRFLEQTIQQNEPRRNTQHGILWHSTEVASYPTKCIYAKFNDSLGSSLPNSIAPIVWKKFIPPRAKLTIWLADKEKLKTGDFLVEKGIISQQNAWCPFCRNENRIKLSFTFCLQICLERVDGSSKMVGPFSSFPYAVLKV